VFSTSVSRPVDAFEQTHLDAVDALDGLEPLLRRVPHESVRSREIRRLAGRGRQPLQRAGNALERLGQERQHRVGRRGAVHGSLREGGIDPGRSRQASAVILRWPAFERRPCKPKPMRRIGAAKGSWARTDDAGTLIRQRLQSLDPPL
jgi:hypothetical protein